MKALRLTLTGAVLWAGTALSLQAQTETSWDETYSLTGTLDEAESDDGEQVYDVLADLSGNKIDLNHTTPEELSLLPFLSSRQIEEITAYLYRYGPMQSLGELALIESLDRQQRQLLTRFVFVGDSTATPRFPALRDILRKGSHELTATGRLPFYERRGDRNGYLGYRYRHWLRYTFGYGQYVKAGITASQDAGEPFFAGRNAWGYDYYSFYLTVRRLGRLRALAVGRYRLRMGMGLVLNRDLSLGKLATLAAPPQAAVTLRGHASRSEATYLQGAAATLRLSSHCDLTAFASWRDIDATPTTDGTALATLLTSGYHRTESEMARKHNASQWAGGSHLAWRHQGFHAGASFVGTGFSKPLQPAITQAYRRWQASGRSFWNASIDYGYISGRLQFDGETATDDGGAVATINTLTLQPIAHLTLTALQRFYSYRYHALLAQSFSDGGHVQNENGLCISARWDVSRRLSLTAYTDYAYSAWPRYLISQPSHAWDHLVQATWQRGHYRLTGRYRLRQRQRDRSDKSTLDPLTEHRARLALYIDGSRLQYHTQADAALTRLGTVTSRGYMLSQHVALPLRHITLYASAAYFHTDDYQSRLYTYERGPLYQFSFPVFYGEGLRYTLMVRASLTSRLLLTARLAATDYLDRSHISSSYQQIDHSSQTDLDLQLRWKF